MANFIETAFLVLVCILMSSFGSTQATTCEEKVGADIHFCYIASFHPIDYNGIPFKKCCECVELGKQCRDAYVDEADRALARVYEEDLCLYHYHPASPAPSPIPIPIPIPIPQLPTPPPQPSPIPQPPPSLTPQPPSPLLPQPPSFSTPPPPEPSPMPQPPNSFPPRPTPPSPIPQPPVVPPSPTPNQPSPIPQPPSVPPPATKPQPPPSPSPPNNWPNGCAYNAVFYDSCDPNPPNAPNSQAATNSTNPLIYQAVGNAWSAPLIDAAGCCTAIAIFGTCNEPEQETKQGWYQTLKKQCSN